MMSQALEFHSAEKVRLFALNFTFCIQLFLSWMSWYSAANSEQSIFWDMLFQAESPTTQIYCILCLHLPSDISALLMLMPAAKRSVIYSAVVNTWCCCLRMNKTVKNHISNKFCFKLFRAKCLIRRHGVVVKPISSEQEGSGFESRLESLCSSQLPYLIPVCWFG